MPVSSQVSISGNQPAFRIVEEQLVINIPGWSVCGYRRTRRTGGHPADIPSLSPSLRWFTGVRLFCLCLIPLLFIFLLFTHLLAPGSVPPSAPLDLSCLSGFHCFVVFFPLPVSPPVICLPLSLPECSDLAFNSSLFRSLPLWACLYGSPSAHTSPPSLSDCKCSNK